MNSGFWGDFIWKAKYKVRKSIIASLIYFFSVCQKLFDHLNLNFCFCGRVPWLYQYWPGGFMLFVVLCPGTPEGSTGSGSGFKASQKTGQRLKVSSDRLGEAGNRTCDPWFTRHRFIPYTTAASHYLLGVLQVLRFEYLYKAQEFWNFELSPMWPWNGHFPIISL